MGANLHYCRILARICFFASTFQYPSWLCRKPFRAHIPDFADSPRHNKQAKLSVIRPLFLSPSRYLLPYPARRACNPHGTSPGFPLSLDPKRDSRIQQQHIGTALSLSLSLRFTYCTSAHLGLCRLPLKRLDVAGFFFFPCVVDQRSPRQETRLQGQATSNIRAVKDELRRAPDAHFRPRHRTRPTPSSVPSNTHSCYSPAQPPNGLPKVAPDRRSDKHHPVSATLLCLLVTTHLHCDKAQRAHSPTFPFLAPTLSPLRLTLLIARFYMVETQERIYSWTAVATHHGRFSCPRPGGRPLSTYIPSHCFPV